VVWDMWYVIRVQSAEFKVTSFKFQVLGLGVRI